MKHSLKLLAISAIALLMCVPAAYAQTPEVSTLVMLSETARHWPSLREVLQASRIAGPQIHDARIAALCRQHGVTELWTADRDYGRFAGVKYKNPLVSGG